jgi:hypothetical protein
MKTKRFPSLAASIAIALFAVAASAHAQTLSVTASPSTITNAGDEATFTITVSPPSPINLSVNFVMSGTAKLGRDYALVGDFNRYAQIQIAAGHATTTVTLHAFYDDDKPGSHETAIFNLFAGPKYRVGTPSSAQVTIQNVAD